MVNFAGEDGLFLGRADDHLIDKKDWNYLSNIADKLTESARMGNTQNNTNSTFNISMEFPDVHDYQDFINKLQSDTRFEKIIQSMTIGKAMGGNSLAKYKYR